MKIIAFTLGLLASTSAHAYTVTVDTTLPTNVGLLDAYVGDSWTIPTSIGTFYGNGIVYPADSFNTGIAVPPAMNGHAYLGINGVEQLNLNTPVTSFSFLWGSIDDYNTFETIGADYNPAIVVPGAGAALLAGYFPGDPVRPNAWVTITSPVAFDIVQFHSDGPAMELQFDPPSVAATPEPSTWLMFVIGIACLLFSAFRQRLATVSQWRRA